MDWYLNLGGHAISLPAAAAIGVGVGLIAGMFGVGGGFLLVPVLDLALGVPLPAAVGVAMCQIIATSLGTFLRLRDFGAVEIRVDLMLFGGSMLGVHAGANVVEWLEDAGAIDVFGHPVAAVRLGITLAYIAAAALTIYLLWTKGASAADEKVAPGPLSRIKWPPLIDLPGAGLRQVSGPLFGLIGFVNGVISGIIGIGGGIILIPIMMYGFGLNIRKVIGTGLLIVLATAIMGTIEHARHGNVHLGLAITVMIGSALTAQVGASITRSVTPRTLRRAFALVLALSATMLVIKLAA